MSHATSDSAELLVYVTISNNAGKLRQQDWALFASETETNIRRLASVVRGAFYSLPAVPSQNACWAFEIRTTWAPELIRQLSRLAARFGQESITWAEAAGTAHIVPPAPEGAATTDPK